jgi:Flp pilus assembly protein CpaB
MELAHRLTSTRRGTLLVSASAALLAGILILVYVQRYRNSVKSEGAPVTVLVASKAIPKGTSGAVIASSGLYTASTVRQSQLVDGAYSDASSLRNMVATRDIYPGSELSAKDFAAASTNLAASLTKDERVMSIPLDAAHGLIRQLEAGDRVDVYAGFNVIPLNAAGIPVAGGQSRPVLRKLMSNIDVISIGSKGNGGFAGSGSANVELKVTDPQAAELAFASDNGKIWLSLRPSTGATSPAPSLVTMETVLLGVPAVTVLHSFGGRR